MAKSDIDAMRATCPPSDFEDVIVAIDPPVTSHSRSDACGIIAARLAVADGFGEKCFVLFWRTHQRKA